MFCQNLSPNATWTTHELRIVSNILWRGILIVFAVGEIKTKKSLTLHVLLASRHILDVDS